MKRLAEAKTFLLGVTFQQRWNYGELMSVLETLASMFGRAALDDRDAIIAEFHDIAGRLPYTGGSDFGALLLESTGDSVADETLAQRLYREAFYRATWCVQGATAGGEAIARSVDYRRIESKVRKSDANQSRPQQ